MDELNQLPQGGEEEVVQEEEELQLPNISDTGSTEKVEQRLQDLANEPTNAVSKFLEDTQVNLRDFVDNTFQGDQRSKDEIRSDREAATTEGQRNLLESQAVLDQSTDPVSETIRAGVGATMDAVESVGSFAKLSKDSIETGIKTVMGKAVSPEENPFSSEYQRGSYFEIPDAYEPENNTNLGKLGRGLVEFGLLTRWSGAYVNAASKAIVNPMGAQFAPKLIRSAGAFVGGNKTLQFLSAGAKISAEGALAELISESSEYGNIANLAQEYTPWLLPGIMERLAVDENDTAWEARLKTVTAGAGLNHIGYFFSALIKGGFKTARGVARNAIKEGKPLSEAIKLGNEAGSKEFQRAMLAEVLNAERGAQKLAQVKLNQGMGIDPSDPLDRYVRKHLDDDDFNTYNNLIEESDNITDAGARVESRATIEELTAKAKSIGAAQGDEWSDVRYSSTFFDEENAGRQPDPTVNPDQFDDIDKASYNRDVDAIENVVEEAKKGEKISTTLFDEADILKGRDSTPNAENVSRDMIKRVSGGDKNLEEIYTEVVDDMTQRMANVYKSEDYEDLVIGAINRAEPTLQRLGDFNKGQVKSILNEYKKSITAQRKGPKGTGEYRTFSYGLDKDGNPRYINTIGPLQKDANIIILKSLAQTISDIATGSLEVSNNLSIMKNYDKLTKLMKEVTLKNKEYMYAWGIDGQLQQGNVKILDTLQARKRGSAFADALKDADKLEKNMMLLKDYAKKTGDAQPIEDLMRVFAMTDGDVLSLDDIGTYLKSYLYGGHFLGYTGAKGQRFKALPSKVSQEIMGITYNGLLARIRTPVKAVLNTGFLSYYKPIMKTLGFLNPLSISRSQIDMGFLNSKGYKDLYPNFKDPEFLKTQTHAALFQLDAATRTMGDTLAVFTRNYRKGIRGEDMDYIGKYAIQRRTKQFKGLQYFKEKYTDDVATDVGYWFANMLHDFNTKPWVRHSTISMGAGDAAARFNIGNQRLAEEAYFQAVESGATIEDFIKFRDKFEELYDKKIFRYKKEKLPNGEEVTAKIVSDKLARLGGDQATLTSNLEGIEKTFTKLLGQIPGANSLFKFITPAINGIKIGFDHSPAAALLNQKYHAMLRGDMVELQKLGITTETLPGQIAEIEGKMAFGTGLIAYMVSLAAQGKLTGDMPRDPGERELWEQSGIRPLSIKYKVPFSNKNVYVSYAGFEIWTTLARVVGNLIHEGDVLGESDLSYSLSKLSTVTGTLLIDNGPLQGLTEMTTLFSAESPDSLFQGSVANLAGSFAPMSGSFADFSDLIDGSMKELEGINAKFIYRSSVFRPLLPPKYCLLYTSPSPRD